MIILPAIDIIGGCAVRLEKGDYNKKTVYSDAPWDVAVSFAKAGAEHIHLVDLDGAKSGKTDNFKTVEKIVSESGLSAELGGGIRTLDTVKRYFDAGVCRVILGTAAVTDEKFLDNCLELYGDRIAVGVDIKDGFVAIHGWTELSKYTCSQFFEKMQKKGVSNIICTDVSRDGMLGGTNTELYSELSRRFSIDITASGGVSSLDDIKKLLDMNMYGAILGKALYTGALDLKAALELAGEDRI